MLRWLLITVVALIALVAVVGIVGWMMPREHIAASSVIIEQPADSVWVVVRDLAGVDAWWPEVKQSERVADEQGREMYRQELKTGFSMALVVVESESPHRLVTEIDASTDPPFGGSWTYEITPRDGASRVTITERGWISNPFFRFMANAFFGMHGTMDSYLEALGAAFNQPVVPVHEGRVS
jgi:uncharacterized protein YndB with AHSA1/START domain